MYVLHANQGLQMKLEMMRLGEILRAMLPCVMKMNMFLRINVSLVRQGPVMVLGMIQVEKILYVMLSFA